ncbi:MAG: trypsin-like peptidase domain-containing protein [Planctomycetota bacterium]
MTQSAWTSRWLIALSLLGFFCALMPVGKTQILRELEQEFTSVAASAGECCVRVDVVKRVSVNQISIRDAEEGKTKLEHNKGEMDILHSLSGILLDTQGYIVTLGDALENNSRVRVVLNHGEKQMHYKAEIIGFDLDSNVGLLKIQDPPPLKLLPLGDSNSLKQGAFVFGVGYTYNLGPSPSFSMGIVNATDRVFSLKKHQDSGRTLIQTSLTIHPGETGGALINSASEVIGVLLTSYSGADSRMESVLGSGYTLAIPMNTVKKEVEWIIAKHAEGSSVLSTANEKEGPWLGLTASEITDSALRNQLRLSVGGVLVSHIFPDDPAAKAGIAENDVLIKWDGVDVKGLEHLKELVGATQSGEKIALVLIRQGEKVMITLNVGEY